MSVLNKTVYIRQKHFVPYLLLGVLFSLVSITQANDSIRIHKDLRPLTTLLDSGLYEKADLWIRSYIKSKKILPDETAYYYGEVLIGLNKKTPARKAYSKYISLTDTAAPYYSRCISQIEKIDCELTGFIVKDTLCEVCHGSKYEDHKCHFCNGDKKVICGACNGTGVYVVPSAYGPIYQTCMRCQGNRTEACINCEGTGKLKSKCSNCRGRGKIKQKIQCR